MKTSVKILLLVLFAIGAIAGVLVFAKTRVAPPSNIKLVNQYLIDLDKSCSSFDAIEDFAQSRVEYARQDDKLKRFLSENVIDENISDAYRKRIDATYGRRLSAYGFGIFQKSVWPKDKLFDMLSMVDSLKADRLSTGESAVTEDFLTSANTLKDIANDYNAALKLSQNTAFISVSNASERINKAREYRNADYLKNNTALVEALNALPEKIAKSHYEYVKGRVKSLEGYENYSRDQYLDEVVPEVNRVINEYKGTSIYGSKKPSIGGLEDAADVIIEAAVAHYKRQYN